MFLTGSVCFPPTIVPGVSGPPRLCMSAVSSWVRTVYQITKSDTAWIIQGSVRSYDNWSWELTAPLCYATSMSTWFFCAVFLFMLYLMILVSNGSEKLGRIIMSSYNGKNLSEMFLQRCCWGFMSSEMWHHVACVVIDISKERSAYVCEGQAVQEAVLPNV